MKIILSLLLLLLLMGINITAQENTRIDLSDFYSSSNHWYNIADEQHVIEPLPGQKRYAPSEITKIADNILLYQKINGGWPKNYDMLAELTKEQVDTLLKFQNTLNSTIDNGATYSHIKYLAAVYSRTNKEKYRDACLRGIDFIVSAQYPNGGWPQFYPDTSGYRKYITFNDDAMIGVVNLLDRICRGERIYNFVDTERLNKIQIALNKAVECILNCQIKENDTLNVWCQQHDNITLLPQWARTFEPPAICNMESSAIIKYLMSIENPSPQVINSIKSAVIWFTKSKISGFRFEDIKTKKEKFMYHTADYDRVLIPDSTAPPLWPRFNELITHRPLFCNRDGKPVYDLAEVEKERRTGYKWYTEDPSDVLRLYTDWKNKWRNK